ncbi:hypothetical protein [Caenispirillum bisanense]|uniref:DUF4136 domain-containing protein n=1 Tax=Caenispirillum bisanense TaxID=414052 RepID=A0A286G2J9_9PROT|nr:hypothetical protein [Caenispirillum bisanense]SOD89745.1 hypothetical protein SAMN05421508_101321 [Caenispirillum bisanense]
MMPTLPRRLLLAASVLLAAAAPLPAAAIEQTVDAELNAQSYAAVPRAPVEVRLYTRTGEVEDLRARATRALEAAGWRVVETGGTLAFSLELAGDDPIVQRGEPGVLAVEGFRGSSGASTDRLYARLKLYSTTESSVLTGQQAPDRRDAGGGTRIQADVTSLTDGRRLWQGWVMVDAAGRAPEVAAEKLLPLLVESIGDTVRGESRKVEFE